MNFCGQCGAANENDSVVCYECGAMLSVPQTVKKKKGISKPLLIGGGVLLAVLLVVGVVFLILSGGKKDLATAFDRTVTAFRGGEDRTRVQTFADELDKYLEDGDYHMSVTCGGTADFSLVTDYSRDGKVMQGTVGMMGMELAYSIDTRTVQFSVPGQFENVYGVQLKKLDQLKNNPLFSSIFGEISGNLVLSADLFAKNDLKTQFRDMAGEEYEALRKSIQIQELEEKELQGQRCQVYEISWSADAAGKLVTALGSMGTLPELGELVTSLIPDLGSACRCYVNKEGYIVGLDFTCAGAQCVFVLEGRENPWDTFTLTVKSIYGDTAVYTGGLERFGKRMRFCLENETGILLSLDYDDDTGEFVICTRDDGRLLSGRVRTDGQLYLSLAWQSEELGQQQLELAVAPLTLQPAPLSEHYIDLLDMNIADMTRFLLDLGIQLN